MKPSDVTLVVVPRERFSFAPESLDNIYARTPGLTHLVYVDAGSPPPIRRVLEAKSVEYGFEYIRTNRYVGPNEARNIGLARVRTPYVLFVDNDVLVEPHWLEYLLECAEQTGAAIVGPMYQIDVGGKVLVHMAGGDAHVEEDGGARYYAEKHRYPGVPIASAPALDRCETELVEFHTMLVRTNVFAQTGPLDEALLSMHEHVDFCMRARELGHRVFFEPRSIITYVPAMRLAASDIPYFMLRWSERWNRSTIAHFNTKWRLDPGHALNRIAIPFGRHHRCRGLRLINGKPPRTRKAWVVEHAVVLAERCVNLAYGAATSA